MRKHPTRMAQSTPKGGASVFAASSELRRCKLDAKAWQMRLGGWNH